MNELLASFRQLDSEWRSLTVSALHVAFILVTAGVLRVLAARLIRGFLRLMERRRLGADQAPRFETLARVFRYAATLVIGVVAGTLVLAELGISVAPVLATAGVAGVAIGFGAQSLIKDYFNGMFLLIEDQIRQGDVVLLGADAGRVEEVTLRYVRLRDYEGHVHFIPNGSIGVVVNRTRDFAYALIDVGVAYREDVDEAFSVIREVGAQMRKDPDFAPRIADDIEIAGVERWADSAVVLRARLKIVPPIEQWNVRRELLRRLKRGFDERGIEIPYPHLTVYAGQAKDGSAPPLRVSSQAAG